MGIALRNNKCTKTTKLSATLIFGLVVLVHLVSRYWMSLYAVLSTSVLWSHVCCLLHPCLGVALPSLQTMAGSSQNSVLDFSSHCAWWALLQWLTLEDVGGGGGGGDGSGIHPLPLHFAGGNAPKLSLISSFESCNVLMYCSEVIQHLIKHEKGLFVLKVHFGLKSMLLALIIVKISMP